MDQVTALEYAPVPVTLAENCWVAPMVRVVAPGETLTPVTAGPVGVGVGVGEVPPLAQELSASARAATALMERIRVR
jgi:hypothetical protein